MKLLIHSQNFNGVTVNACKLISNYIEHFTEHVLTHPFRDYIKTMLVKGHPGNTSILYESIDICHWSIYSSSLVFCAIMLMSMLLTYPRGPSSQRSTKTSEMSCKPWLTRSLNGDIFHSHCMPIWICYEDTVLRTRFNMKTIFQL